MMSAEGTNHTVSSLPSALEKLSLEGLGPLSPEIITQQATINIGTIGHVAHGKSTVVKAISGVQTVRFKNELERNITIKLGYANAKVPCPLISPLNIDLQVPNLSEAQLLQVL